MAAVTTYATLNTYINALFDRATDTTFTAQNDTFIGLAEAAFSPKLLSRRMETTASLTVTSGSASLPSDFFRARTAYATISNVRVDLPFITPAQEMALYPIDTGDAVYSKIVGSTYYTVPSDDLTVTLDYLARFTGLSSGNTTNWIITYHPNLYVDAVAAQAARWIQDTEKAVMYERSWRDIQDQITDNYAIEYFNNTELTLDSPTP